MNGIPASSAPFSKRLVRRLRMETKVVHPIETARAADNENRRFRFRPERTAPEAELIHCLDILV